MLNVTKILSILLFVGIATVAALGDDIPASGPASCKDSLANTREQEGTYRPRGTRTAMKVYFCGDEKVGERVFYKNGTTAEERLYKGGQLDGATRLFYESGKLFAELPYAAGKLNGAVRFYKDNGDLLGESKFDNGTGVLRQFPLRSLGLTDMEIPYKNGVFDGTEREWGHFLGGKGIGCSVSQYSDGKMNGWSVALNEDGSLLESGYWYKGQFHGVNREFLSDGKPAKGYPKFFVNNKEVTEAAYRTVAKSDEILAKSLKDDGVEWGKKACAAPRCSSQPTTSTKPAE